MPAGSAIHRIAAAYRGASGRSAAISRRRSRWTRGSNVPGASGARGLLVRVAGGTGSRRPAGSGAGSRPRRRTARAPAPPGAAAADRSRTSSFTSTLTPSGSPRSASISRWSRNATANRTSSVSTRNRRSNASSSSRTSSPPNARATSSTTSRGATRRRGHDDRNGTTAHVSVRRTARRCSSAGSSYQRSNACTSSPRRRSQTTFSVPCSRSAEHRERQPGRVEPQVERREVQPGVLAQEHQPPLPGAAAMPAPPRLTDRGHREREDEPLHRGRVGRSRDRLDPVRFSPCRAGTRSRRRRWT